MKLTTQPLTPEALHQCLRDLRPADRAELEAAGVQAEAIERAAFDGWSEAGVWNGRPVFVFGVRSVGDIGVPWMLSTAALAEADPSAVARLARRVVARMRREHKVLTNFVHEANADAQRFIRWLGFTVLPDPAGRGGAFRQFVWRRHV